MSAMWWALLTSFGMTALLSLAWVRALDRNEPRRQAVLRAKRGEPVLAPLPRVVARPAVSRRGNKWPWIKGDNQW